MIEKATGADEEKTNYTELRDQGFFDRSLTIRILIGLFFTLALLSFLHFRGVRLDTLELNTVSNREIVAPIDFQVPDESATLFLRQEAVQGVGRVYRLAPTEIAGVAEGARDNFTPTDELSQEDFDEGVALFAQTLEEARFTDPETINEMVSASLPVYSYVALTVQNPEQPLVLSDSIFGHLADLAFGGKDLEPASIEAITEPFDQIGWTVTPDLLAEQAIAAAIQRQIPQQYRLVKAGSRIIDRGEIVTPRHVVTLSAMQGALEEGNSLFSPGSFAGSLILTLLLVTVAAAYMRMYHQNIFQSNRKLFLVVSIVVLNLLMAKGVEFVFLHATHLIEAVRFPLFVPFTAILVCALTNARLATWVSGFVLLVLVITLPVAPIGFLVINFLTSFVAILNTRSLRQRKEVFVVCAKVWFVCILVLVGFQLYETGRIELSTLLIDLLSTAFFMLGTAVLVVGLLPLLESLFRIVTDVTLMEFMDPAHPLLRRLALEAPGTYHHSIVLGNIAESAANAIGANGLFCRAATLYHDVGKLANPQYFTENQVGGMNIHQLLTPIESAQVILDHVPEGVALARKYNLPEPFIDIIKEHHGTTLVYYFYRKQVELMGGDESLVDRREFQYSGPRPRTKEAAIIMIADTIEAASRSLEDLSEERVAALIDRMVGERIDGGQLDESPLTFQELQKVKRSILQILLIAGHSRVKYPVPPPRVTSQEKPPPAGSEAR
jgi:cyclic-di-AMP phosphodiesterase PgpH